MFYCEFFKIFNTIFFTEHVRVTASGKNTHNFIPSASFRYKKKTKKLFKTIFLKTLLKIALGTRLKHSSVLRSKKVYGLKMEQSITYVKQYFYMFYSSLKDILQVQNKINNEISWNRMIICLTGIFQKNIFVHG